MPNGGVPIPNRPAEYNQYKDGVCVTSGQYKGCIDVNGTYYWIYAKKDHWAVATGLPESNQVLIGEQVWQMCKAGGSYNYDGQEGGWYDGQQQLHMWDGKEGQEVHLVG